MALRQPRLCVHAGTVALLLVLSTAALPQPPAGLARGFTDPPDSAKPHTWWHWMNGNISAAGITRDLEEMRRVGVGGAQIFDVTDGIPPGPVDYMSDEWRAMVKHAVTEADRLGIELCIHNCAGWSSSGGPWITPELAMQIVTVSETRATGAATVDQVLAQPPTTLETYRDIAVIAFPTPPAETVRMADADPSISAGHDDFDGAALIDGDPSTSATLWLRNPRGPQHIQLAFDEPFEARALSITPTVGKGGHPGEVQVSDDGVEYRKIADFRIPDTRFSRGALTVSFAPVSGRFYRVQFTRRRGQPGAVGMREIELGSGMRIANWIGKAGFTRTDAPGPDTREVPGDALAPTADVRVISESMDPDGRLVWDAPPGEWTILRFGYTPTGKTNHPASESGIGLECDKLSAEAAQAHIDGMLAQVLEDIGPLAGKSLNNVLIDSYEVGSQNWTPRMREEFRSRRGYDLLPYLPALTGRVVGSMHESERFLWDFRKTLAELFRDNYFGYFAEYCHEHGLALSTEPYGNGNFDNLASGGRGDIPMTEFWVGAGSVNGGKLAGSIAHTHGQRFVGAEAFTANPEAGGWRNHPYSLKALGDIAYANGVNRFIFHRYAHQPWEGVLPGMTMGPHGFHFERTSTWWDQGRAWLKYLARCQYLLQSGLFAADLCYLVGENSPSGMPHLDPAPPEGYDWDAISPEALVERTSVRDGRLVLPDGMSYELLILPNTRVMRPELLAKIGELVRAGATIVGPRPTASPSLVGYPDCDDRVTGLAEEVWGDCDGETVTSRACGDGTVIWGRPLEDVLAARDLPPDFEATGAPHRPNLSWIHRTVDDAEVYFVANGKKRGEAALCTFRVAGKAPELWRPDTGVMERAPVFQSEGGRTTLPVRFGPAGSVFVVFRRPAGSGLVDIKRNGTSIYDPTPRDLPELKIESALYGVLTVEQPDMVDITEHVRTLVRDDTLTVQASNSIGGDPIPNVIKELRIEYAIDGEAFEVTVGENQTATLPTGEEGREGALTIRRALYGLLPAEPLDESDELTVDVTDVLRGRIEGGMLSVMANNNLAGDPANLIQKQLRVDYTLDGEPYTKTINENQSLDLPDGSEQVLALEETPAPDATLSAKGELNLAAWEPGVYEAETSEGDIIAATVAGIPEPRDIAGPWDLSFPDGLGAPTTATLAELSSWTDNEDAGIRYFSGTATYTRQIDIPADWLGRGKRVMLDLGSVREIAEVRLNGEDLGVLWKPPFRIDVTAAASRGSNGLEVRVTNLWGNRLIGDAQHPDDVEWSGSGLQAIPEWLLTGAARPATERITLTTWKHYAKDSPLTESGLIGPVRLRSGRVAELTRQ